MCAGVRLCMSMSSVLSVYLSVRLFVLCVCRLVHVFCLSMCRSILRVCSWWVHVRVRLLVPPSLCLCVSHRFIRVLVCLAVRISVYLSVRPFCTFRRLPNRGLASQRSNPDLTPRSHPNPSHRAGHTGLVLRDLACDSLAARRRPCLRLPLMQLSNGPACCCSSGSSAAALPAAAPLVAQ